MNCKGIIFPIGFIEEHVLSGAIGRDALTAESVANEVAQSIGVLLSPSQNFGMEAHHLDSPVIMILKSNTLKLAIHDLVISLAQNGI